MSTEENVNETVEDLETEDDSAENVKGGVGGRLGHGGEKAHFSPDQGGGGGGGNR